ncbi:MAG TPA: Smr/MutS family protein [Phenylobacterium sp.]|uniref:Smr/MutS family protein n=1 Tax=Phenylobacterium sp. TaxID=1871053 RepID=UPI002CAF7326|nr:Smr/MutS family protein [Phenylobacterium sp.]HSV02235.1 Smr/MutS family protein [Phenylobacterium sp.]
MKRPLKPEELRLWGLVAGTVHPLPGKATPEAPTPSLDGEGQAAKPSRWGSPGQPPASQTAPHLPTLARVRSPVPPQGGEGKDIEPRRKHRIVREREAIGARLDLHGLDQDRARALLDGFLRRAWDEGYRAVLVITGKGLQGDGVLRRMTPEWLAAPRLSEIVAGISEAHRRHGGEGALYVALKRKPRG